MDNIQHQANHILKGEYKELDTSTVLLSKESGQILQIVDDSVPLLRWRCTWQTAWLGKGKAVGISCPLNDALKSEGNAAESPFLCPKNHQSLAPPAVQGRKDINNHQTLFKLNVCFWKLCTMRHEYMVRVPGRDNHCPTPAVQRYWLPAVLTQGRFCHSPLGCSRLPAK